MDKDLYFLNIIAEAFQHPEPSIAFREAFKRIKACGQRPGYERGFRQFKHFMAVINDRIETFPEVPEVKKNQDLIDLAFQFAAGMFDGDQNDTQALFDLIRSQPDLKRGFDELCEEASKSIAHEIGFEIIIERNGEKIISIPVEGDTFSKMVKNISPGNYVIKLSTGRILWQGKLADRDLLWTVAFPEKDLALAADTGDIAKNTTREIMILDGELIFRVSPGIESGYIELEKRF